jgi:hypothetical protein
MFIPFAQADDDATLGVVRILDMKPVAYDSATGAIIPDSQNIIFIIVDIQFDTKKPGRVWLLAEKGGQYGALLVHFNSATFDNDIPQKFGEFLRNTPGFQINLNKETLSYKNNGLDTYAEVSAENIKVYSAKLKDFVSLKATICPMTPEEQHWWSLGKPQIVRKDCL